MDKLAKTELWVALGALFESQLFRDSPWYVHIAVMGIAIAYIVARTFIKAKEIDQKAKSGGEYKAADNRSIRAPAPDAVGSSS